MAGSLAVLVCIAAAMANARTQARRGYRRAQASSAAHARYLAEIDARLELAAAEYELAHPTGGARCHECGTRLRSLRGLAQHERAKHG